MSMQIIPVLDLKAGQAVHAVRGDREEYVPVQSKLGRGDDPVALARAYRDRLGCATCYVADLDAIAGIGENSDIVRALVAEGLNLWLDAGVARVDKVRELAGLNIAKVIIGSETLPSSAQLFNLAIQIPPDQLAFSLDLQQGVLRAPGGIDTPQEMVALVAEAGFDDVILLDLARVGTVTGPPLDLLAMLRPHFPDLAFFAGGGRVLPVL
jgi:phosphoribosylformimino-5-aminoimidazole carboxamide ribotide isomerase